MHTQRAQRLVKTGGRPVETRTCTFCRHVQRATGTEKTSAIAENAGIECTLDRGSSRSWLREAVRLLVEATNVEIGCETNSNTDAVVRSATPMTSSRFSKRENRTDREAVSGNDARRGNRRNSRRRTALDRDRVAMAGT